VPTTRTRAPWRRRSGACLAAIVLALTGCTSQADDGSAADDPVTDGTTDGEERTDGDLDGEPDDGATDDGTGDGTEASDGQDGDHSDGTDELEPIAEDADTAEKTTEGAWPGTDEDGELLAQAVTDVRIGTHDGFDRVVLELVSEGGEPGWIVRYGEPLAQGSGEEVEVEGEAVLLVTIRPVLLPPDLPPSIETWFGPPIAGRPDGVIEEVASGTVYEGHHEFFVGLDEERPFVVEQLEDPLRVVVDIFHGSG
jgi:hypothetical protein